MITIGCDPEVFLRKGDSIISAIGLIGGSKSMPRPCLDGSLQEDNVLAEINITPADTPEDFIYRIESVLGQLRNVTGCDLEIKASHHFDISYLKSLGSKAVELGCDPDYNAYTGEKNKKPNPYQSLRTAAGHVHIGVDDADVVHLVKCLDLFLGVPSVVLDHDTERRSMYGKAGCYRPKPYGVEYRTLSNFWLKEPSLMQWVFNTTKLVAETYKDISLPDELTIQECINNSNLSVANQLITEYNLEVV